MAARKKPVEQGCRQLSKDGVEWIDEKAVEDRSDFVFWRFVGRGMVGQTHNLPKSE